MSCWITTHWPVPKSAAFSRHVYVKKSWDPHSVPAVGDTILVYETKAAQVDGRLRRTVTSWEGRRPMETYEIPPGLGGIIGSMTVIGRKRPICDHDKVLDYGNLMDARTGRVDWEVIPCANWQLVRRPMERCQLMDAIGEPRNRPPMFLHLWRVPDAFVAALLALTNDRAREGRCLSGGDLHSSQPGSSDASLTEALGRAISAVIQDDYGHVERVRSTARLIGEEIGLPSDELKALDTAAMLHDIGKLAVPGHILVKASALTDEEMRKVQTHTMVGAAILEHVVFPWPVVPIIRSTHEWFDGTGYPDRLAGEQIPMGARVLAVADVYEALRSRRPYRPAMAIQEVVAFMRERSGVQFDPKILEAFFRALSARQVPGASGSTPQAGPGYELVLDTPGRRAIFAAIKRAHE